MNDIPGKPDGPGQRVRMRCPKLDSARQVLPHAQLGSFEQCPHRMARAKCDFYTPNDSSRALLLEA